MAPFLTEKKFSRLRRAPTLTLKLDSAPEISVDCFSDETAKNIIVQ